MNTHSKFGSDVETTDATYTHQKCLKKFATHIMRFSGWLLSKSRNALRKQGNDTGLEILWWLGGGDRVKVPVNSLFFPLTPKKRAPRHSNQLAQVWGRKGIG